MILTNAHIRGSTDCDLFGNYNLSTSSYVYVNYVRGPNRYSIREVGGLLNPQ